MYLGLGFQRFQLMAVAWLCCPWWGSQQHTMVGAESGGSRVSHHILEAETSTGWSSQCPLQVSLSVTLHIGDQACKAYYAAQLLSQGWLSSIEDSVGDSETRSSIDLDLKEMLTREEHLPGGIFTDFLIKTELTLSHPYQGSVPHSPFQILKCNPCCAAAVASSLVPFTVWDHTDIAVEGIGPHWTLQSAGALAEQQACVVCK